MKSYEIIHQAGHKIMDVQADNLETAFKRAQAIFGSKWTSISRVSEVVS